MRPACTRLAASSETAGRNGTGASATMCAAFFAATRARSSGLLTACSGAPSLYGHKQREPEASVNFVTCHDGFTLNDLVSYDRKHNEANGEGNRDGADDNRSWNCGIEGPTDDPAIDQLRTRQVKNFLAVTMLSPGMPMMLMGDELRRTQGGNNNAYCQDNETSWFDWALLAKRADVHRFVAMLNARRVLRDAENERQRVALNELIRQGDITWHGVTLDRPDWSASSHSIAFTAKVTRERVSVHVILNAYWEPLEFELPPPPDGCPTPMAPLDRHLPRLSRRHRRVGRRTSRSRSSLSGRATLRGGAGRRPRRQRRPMSTLPRHSRGGLTRLVRAGSAVIRSLTAKTGRQRRREGLLLARSPGAGDVRPHLRYDPCS